MAATSNSLSSGETPGQRSNSSPALAPCCRPPRHRRGHRGGANPAWGLLVRVGGASGLERYLQTQPGHLPWPWMCRGVCAASLGGGRPVLGTLGVPGDLKARPCCGRG